MSVDGAICVRFSWSSSTWGRKKKILKVSLMQKSRKAKGKVFVALASAVGRKEKLQICFFVCSNEGKLRNGRKILKQSTCEMTKFYANFMSI